MRLNKYLAHAGIASRRQADILIQSATTSVNGVVITDPAFQVQENDEVIYDGQRIYLNTETVVICLNKPKGVVTTAHDPQGRPTVLACVPHKERLFPIGRLDQDTTGLILLTNDGDLAQYLMHPRNQVPRVYEAVVEGRLTEKMIKKIVRGIFIGNGELGKARILRQTTRKGRTTVTLELRQGKKREIRRLFSALDVRLFSLHRIQYGGLSLRKLGIGEWRTLTREEIKALHQT